MATDRGPRGLTLRNAFHLARRNLTRSRRRTAITATTVALAVFLLQCFSALLIGIERQSFDNLIRYQTSNAKVFAAGYYQQREEFPLEKALVDPASLEQRIDGIPGVAASTPRIEFSAQLSNGADQIQVTGIGIAVSGSDRDVYRIAQAVVAGSYLQPGEEGLLIGADLAKHFPVGVGDWLTVLVRTRRGAYEAIDLPVRGLLGTGNPLIDKSVVMLPLETARRMLGMPGMATEIAVRFSATSWELPTLTRLRASLEAIPGIEVRGWRELEENFLALAKVKRSGQTIFMGIFVLLALVGITNTILMATFERTREIGALMAMGLRPAGVRRLFLVEGAVTGLVGSLLGSLLALGLILWLASVGIDVTAAFGEMDIGYPVKDMLYPAVDLLWMLTVILFTGLMATVAALYPAARASRLDPAEALRHV
jgi:ABC-type lipoprotein release transport system permease subunit